MVDEIELSFVIPVYNGASSVGAVQRRDDPLFRQDRPWEPRLDNGCELAELSVASLAPH